MKIPHILLIGLGAMLLALPVVAQVDRANVKGTIIDVSGAVVSGAEIRVLFSQTGFTRSVRTGATGEYVLPGLPLGSCVLTVNAQGFNPQRVENIDLAVGDNRTVDAKMTVSTVAQEISVSESAATLEKENAATGGVIDREQVQNLPINGRNWAGLMILVPGAINTGAGNQASIRFAGHGLDDNKILFDGVDATAILRQYQKSDLRIQIASESIAEFRINTALYTAEYGGVPGGQGDVVSRTGTNKFHGSIYEFVRNDIFNARALFSTSKLALRLNQLGASVGGPIYKDHTFFFMNYEGLRQLLVQPLIGFVPSPAFIQSTETTTPAVTPLLNAYPKGQSVTSNPNLDNWAGSGRAIQNEDFGLVRVDQTFNPKTSAFLRLNFDQGRISAPNGDSTGYLLDTVSTQNSPKNGVISVQHTFLPTLLNELKVSANRTPFTTQNVSAFPDQLQLTGFSTLHDNLFQLQNSTAYSVIDTVDLSFGKHSIATGGGLRRVEINLGNSAETQFTYTSAAHLAANTMDSAAVLAAVPTEGVRKTEYDLFVQDQYKLRPNITLSVGLRYDYFGVFHEIEGRDLPFDPLTCGGYCAKGSAFYNSDPKDLGPRVAVTWAPAALHDNTVFRGGYGLYFGEGQLGDLTGPLNNLTSRLALSSAQIPTLSFPVDPFLALGASTASAPRGLYRGRVNQQINQWGLSAQQRLPFQIRGELGYIGSHGAHIPTRSYLNVLIPGTNTRPLPAFGQVDYKKMGNNANFAGLLASVTRSNSHGLIFGANYLWSHSTNDGSTGGGEQDYPENVACRICERASSDQDIRSSFTANAVYPLPFGPGMEHLNSGGVVSRVFGGWQLSGIAIARTGLPVNVSVSRSASSIPDGNSTSIQRPDLAPGVSLIPSQGRSPQHWINPAAFVVPASGTFGNAPRNPLRGPGTWQIDTSVEKQVIQVERFALTFRGDAFNLFNHAEYGLPAANISSPANFGVITTQLNSGATGTATQRVFQLSLRLVY
jgi:hypothetical protein